jgi:hypothetical protein
MHDHILTFAELTPEQQAIVPPLAERQALRKGDTARLYVKLEDGSFIAPWVEVVNQVREGLFLGEVGREHAFEWVGGFSVLFTPEQVIEL